jgi:hypothetical protein
MWTPDSSDSPDRLDALVWALTELKDNAVAHSSLAAISKVCAACQMPNLRSAKTCQYCYESLGV